MEGVWEEFQTMQDKNIPRFKVLKQITTSTLIQKGVMQEGNVYDFHEWNCSLAMKSVFDHKKDECIEIEGLIQGIQSKILASIEEIIGTRCPHFQHFECRRIEYKDEVCLLQRVGVYQEESIE